MNRLHSLFTFLLLIGIGYNIFLTKKLEKKVTDEIQKLQLVTTKQEVEDSPFNQIEDSDPNTTGRDFPKSGMTKINIPKSVHDFGTIKEGKVYETEFELENTGEENLIINNCKASCGCTVPEWNHEPIKPGSSTKIKVKFDAIHRLGNQVKTVIVTTNTQPAQNTLEIRAEVEE